MGSILDLRKERRGVVDVDELGLEEAGDGIKVGCEVVKVVVLQSDSKCILASDKLLGTCSFTN